MANQPVRELINIGEKTAVWLARIGIHTQADLQAMGAVEAYWLIKQQQAGTTAVLLYALHGAQHNLHWNTISSDQKTALRQQAQKLRFFQS